MAAAKNVKYPGALGTPLPSIVDPLRGIENPTPAQIDEVVKAHLARLEERERLLLAHFGPPDRWSEAERWHLVARMLAQAHVPGFQMAPESKRAGAPTKWDRWTRARLRMEVDDLVAEQAGEIVKGVEWACGVLCRRAPWKSILSRKGGPSAKAPKDPGGALAKQYREGDPALVPIVRLLERGMFAATDSAGTGKLPGKKSKP